MSDHQDHAQVFRAFCDENRLMILEMLRTGEKCACILLEKMNIAQPTLSHHMRILCDSGIVVPRKVGKWTYYSISAKGGDRAKDMLITLTTVDDTSEGGCCE
ncbi:MAG: metalloregulator ArsR/SmtB family transcription factor [Methanomassiliicoccaceae archaeon]|jgi:ArsR family transcriptional regulator|nr:metalloregulator ArsR/SmtB family transcription factor [Methanomassiliicoccaceae archaeon]